MKDTNDKIQTCVTCKRRKMNLKQGVLCGLTNEKPSFIDTCEQYIIDEEEMSYRQEKETEAKRDALGYIDPEDGILPSASTFRLIAGISVAIILSYYFKDNEVNVYGFDILSTSLFNSLKEFGLINPVVSVFCMLLTPLFFYITWWFASKKGYRYCYNLGYLVVLTDTIALIILLIEYFSLSLVLNLLVRCWFLFFGFKIFSANSKECKFVKFRSVSLKLLYTILAIFVMTSSIMIVKLLKDLSSIDKDNIELFVRIANKDLPEDMGDGVVYKSISYEGGNIVMDYELTDVALDSLPISSSITDMLRVNYKNDETITEICDIIMNCRCNLIYRFYDNSSCLKDSIVVSYDELQVVLPSQEF